MKKCLIVLFCLVSTLGLCQTEAKRISMVEAIKRDVPGVRVFSALEFFKGGEGFYVDKNYLAVNPNKNQEASSSIAYTSSSGQWTSEKWDLVFLGIGENDGRSEYQVKINNRKIGVYQAPLSQETFAQGSKYCKVWKDVSLRVGNEIKVTTRLGTDGKEFSRGRWAGIVLAPPGGASEQVLAAVDRNAAAKGWAPELARPTDYSPEITGELKTWHKITLTFNGPETSETDRNNPFLNYKLDVNFKHLGSGEQFRVPGYFAADGDAGNTSATKGNKWRVHFAPNQTGTWSYVVNFRKGNYAAVSDRIKTGVSAGYMDGYSNAFAVAPTDKAGRDFRGKGFLEYTGERYLRFAGTGEYFLKVGADAPENLLAYEEFDGTFHNDGHKDELVKNWEAHEKHWNEGDPTWKNGKGKDIVGAINYLASKGMNAVSFLTMNIKGDDQNVFPYIDYDTHDRMDCSKLDQWEVLFSHADQLGLFLHFKLSEVENQGLLDNGGVGAHRSLYYREMIARFGHHLALNWNLCEENGDWVKNNRTPPQFTRQRLAMGDFFAHHDPYKHHIVIHNGKQFDDLLGVDSPYTGVSVQTHRPNFDHVHSAVLKWIRDSKKAGKQWAVACDEPGDASHSLLPDAEDPEHNDARKNGLWGAFMAGAWGTEWYFGYQHPHSDLTCQDYASRDLFWEQGKVALDFFAHHQIPFWEMESADELVLNKSDYCFAKPDAVYVFFLKNGTAKADLSSSKSALSVKWYNPRTGGALQAGSVQQVEPAEEVDLGQPPADEGQDWVVLLRKAG